MPSVAFGDPTGDEPMRRSVLIAPALLTVAMACAAARSANAADSCVVTGKSAVKANTLIYDAEKAGKPIAKLTGAEVPLVIRGFGAAAPGGRVHVSTSGGGGYLRVEGWAPAAAFRFFAARDLAAVGSSVWISHGQQLALSAAHGGLVEVSHRVLGSNGQVLRAAVPCAAITLSFPAIADEEPPERARTYQTRSSSVELYDHAGGEAVFTLQLKSDARKVLWSTESRGGFLHVVSRSDVTIDAWVRWRDVTALRHAELFDPSYAAPQPWPVKKLAIKDPPPVRVAKSELPVHAKAGNALEAVGAIEAGTRFYAMEQSGDWTSVLPENLGVLPADGAGFWVRTATLPPPE